MAKTYEEILAEAQASKSELDKKKPKVNPFSNLQEFVNYNKDLKAANAAVKSAEQSIQANETVGADIQAGKSYANTILGEDFALSRLNDNQNIQDLRSQLQSTASMTDAERIAQRESAYDTLQSQEGTQNRSLIRQLSAAGIKGGAAAGAVGDLAAQQAANQRALNQNLYLSEQQLNRQGLQNLANFELGVQQFDIGQEQAELSAKIQTQLAGTSMISNERAGLRQQEAALAAANAQSGGKK